MIGDSLKNEKRLNKSRNRKRKKTEFTIYTVIVLGMDFFLGVWSLWLNIDHTQPNTFWNRTLYCASQEL
jgi:hypothetical protein